MKETIQQWPKQKTSFKSKGKEWRKKHLDWADDNSRLFNETVRKRQHEKKINIDFYNGIIHKEDMKLTLNPNDMENFYVPNAIQHYPIVAPRIDVLVGEEAARKFDWTVRIINPTSITKIERNKRDQINDSLNQVLMNENLSEQEVQKEMESIADYMNFEWQDIREKRANELLRHFSKELDVKQKFSLGLKDALIHAEEGYYCDIIHNNPVFETLNPLKTYVIQHGHSSKFEDASIIVIDDYWSPGKGVDTFNEDLKDKDIDYLMNFSQNKGGRELDGDLFKEDIDDREGIYYKRSLAGILDDNLDVLDQFTNFNNKNEYFDMSGNVRVLRVFWRSYKKILVVEWIDKQGDKQIKYRNENYIAIESIGEKVTGHRWVSQWWQGTKLAKNVYVDMRPRPIQYNKIGNPGYNTPGVVGQIYNTNDQKAVSLLDRAKVFNYIFNGAFFRLMEAYSKFFGPVLEIDKAKFPEGWDITKTLYFAKKAGILVIDSFKEGNKGQSTGKLAGAVGNTSGKIYNADIGNYIARNIEVMEYAKSMMDEIIGVPKQRLGNVEKRETVGGVDTAIRQSNYVTEMIFKTHQNVKRRALELLLETAKIAMRGNKLKLAYIGSDYSNQIMEIDGDEFQENDYGLEITNDTESDALEQNLDMLAQAALQNQTLSFSTITKIYTSPSLTEIQRLIEKDEKQLQARQGEAAEADREAMQQIEAQKIALEQEKINVNYYDIDERSRLKELELLMDSGGEEGISSQDTQKLELEYKKHLDGMNIKYKELDDKDADRAMKRAEHKDKMVLENKKLAKATTASKAK
jgi:hypothetical protein